MEKSYIESASFDHVDFAVHPLGGTEYENCRFMACHFTNAGLDGIHFIDCTFQDCSFNLTRFGGTVLRDVRFVNSKLVGLHFEQCSDFLFSAGFDNCQLQLCSFLN